MSGGVTNPFLIFTFYNSGDDWSLSVQYFPQAGFENIISSIYVFSLHEDLSVNFIYL